MSKLQAGVILFAFTLGLAAGVWSVQALRNHQQPPAAPAPAIVGYRIETPEPPMALDPEPRDAAERIGWIERIVERRMARALESDPDARGGPFVDALAVKLAAFVRRVLGVALGLAVAAAIAAFLWSNWHWIAGWAAVQLALSWMAGRLGAKKK